MTILVVEDQRDVLTLASDLLTARGHTVIATTNPDEAPFAVAEHGSTPDLLLVDMFLPDRSGLDYARELRSSHPAMKVVFISGWPYRASGTTHAGLAPVLRKPFTAEELYEAIET